MKDLRTALLVLGLCTAIPLAAIAEGAQRDHSEAIRRMDSDNDQRISESEYMAAQREEFQRVDRDGDSSLNVEEQRELARIWTEDRAYERARPADEEEESAAREPSEPLVPDSRDTRSELEGDNPLFRDDAASIGRQ